MFTEQILHKTTKETPPANERTATTPLNSTIPVGKPTSTPPVNFALPIEFKKARNQTSTRRLTAVDDNLVLVANFLIHEELTNIGALVP